MEAPISEQCLVDFADARVLFSHQMQCSPHGLRCEEQGALGHSDDPGKDSLNGAAAGSTSCLRLGKPQLQIIRYFRWCNPSVLRVCRRLVFCIAMEESGMVRSSSAFSGPCMPQQTTFRNISPIACISSPLIRVPPSVLQGKAAGAASDMEVNHVDYMDLLHSLQKHAG